MLVSGGASAYFYDSPGTERHGAAARRRASIPTFGSGTLGYVNSTLSARSRTSPATAASCSREVDVAARNRHERARR